MRDWSFVLPPPPFCVPVPWKSWPSRTPAALPSGTLLWSFQKDGDKRTWLLQTGGASLASLTWERRFSSIATARTADASWRYERQGVFRHRFLISDQDGDPIAEYRARWTKAGTLTLRNG